MVRGKTTHVWFAVAALLVGVAALGSGGCRKEEPAFCCATPETCAQNGWPTTDCPSGEVCSIANRCVVSGRCSGAADCTPDKPLCNGDGVCVACSKTGPGVPDGCPVETPRCDIGGTDACAACESDDDCAGYETGYNLCDTAGGGCVECRPSVTPSDCTNPNAPVCDAETKKCRPCEIDDDCGASGVCLQGGACAAPDRILHVDLTGNDGASCANPCTSDAPCRSLACAIGKLDESHDIIRVGEGEFLEATPLALSGKNALIAGRGPSTRFRPGTPNSAPTFAITGMANIELRSLRVFRGDDITSHGVECDRQGASMPTVTLRSVVIGKLGTELGNRGDGVNAQACNVTVETSTIASNEGFGVSAADGSLVIHRSTISGNRAGGIEVLRTRLDLSNSFIVGNGLSTDVGGLRMTTAPAESIVRFNTLADNRTLAGAAGIQCTTLATATVTNNIVYRNVATNPTLQVSNTGCMITSNLSDEAIPGGNLQTLQTATQLFVSPGTDYHLAPGGENAAIDRATSTIDLDFDGDTRPFGDGPDLGADEVRP